MAKRMNPFADDFKELNQTAEKTVLAFKSQGEEKNKESAQQKQEVRSGPIQKEQRKPRNRPSCEVKQTRNRSLSDDKKKTKTKKEKHKEWGKPVASFNTRVPPEMSELLDDLVYQQRKQGTPKTKQDLAREALADLLRKHAMI